MTAVMLWVIAVALFYGFDRVATALEDRAAEDLKCVEDREP